MALQSKLFRGDSKLDAALVSDPAHILQGANGPHVAKIQQAIIQLDGASISADGAYGPKTADAVADFKRKRSIFNTSGQIDDIVGKKTMAALDREMLAKEGAGAFAKLKPGILQVAGQMPIVILPSFEQSDVASSGVASNSNGSVRRFGIGRVGDPPKALSPLFVVDFNEAPDTFILSQSVDLTNGPNGDKNDLNASNPPFPPLTFLEKVSIAAADADFVKDAVLTGKSKVQVMENRALAESLIGGQSDGIDLMQAFFGNNNVAFTKTHAVGSRLSNRVAKSNGFKSELAGVTKDITEAVQRQFMTGVIDYTKMRGVRRALPGKNHARISNPNGVKGIVEVGYDLTEPDMVALIGSFQGCTLFLNNFTVDFASLTYRAKLRFKLTDHFGVDNSDIIFDGKGHGTPGQRALWLLQHQERPGHIPYVFDVFVDADIVGPLVPQSLPNLVGPDLEILPLLLP